MFFSIRRAWPSSSSIMTMRTGLACWFTSNGSDYAAQIPREGDFKGRSGAQFRLDADIAAYVPSHRADMGEADTLAGLILRSRPAEQLENALVVLGRNAPAIVLDL